MYGMAQKIPDSSLIEEIAESFIDTLYSTKWYMGQFFQIWWYVRMVSSIPQGNMHNVMN